MGKGPSSASRVRTGRPQVVLLGPQRFRPTLASALRSLGVAGRVAVVTAGWQEREHETEELAEHLGCEPVNLFLYRRGEEVGSEDRELADALRERQELLQEYQQLYRLRLGHALDAARELLARGEEGEALEQHRRAAIRAVRTVDRQHLVQLRKLHVEFAARFDPSRRPAVARQRVGLQRALDSAAALAVAGGHVAVLLNRLRLFDILPMLGDRPVVAWSAGAMALGERVVLFHDSPPQGAGNAEVLEAGLALFPNLVPLPDARRRLRLSDAARVALFARRFSPAVCVALDPESRVDWDGRTLTATRATLRLARNGEPVRMSRA